MAELILPRRDPLPEFELFKVHHKLDPDPDAYILVDQYNFNSYFHETWDSWLQTQQAMVTESEIQENLAKLAVETKKTGNKQVA